MREKARKRWRHRVRDTETQSEGTRENTDREWRRKEQTAEFKGKEKEAGKQRRGRNKGLVANGNVRVERVK